MSPSLSSSSPATAFDPKDPRQMAALKAEIGHAFPQVSPGQLDAAIRCAVGQGTGKRKAMVVAALAKMYLAATRR